jgi:hypothetical protein
LDAGKGWTVTLELLRVTSSAYVWGEDTGNFGAVTDEQAQLTLRYGPR